ncbi:MAG: Eco57I restriction-modification methylase domain-containing protein [Anaerolineae bacterium]|nr:Eco57I restriction-modification methylase domain-containing protein [Anaerolineae bacterium]
MAGQGKKADYAFRTGGEKFDFLVEAKKPSVNIPSSPEAAFQLRRYGWSAKLPINILTDFEHFAVYDCRAKPSYEDKASVGRILLIHYKEYVARWDEIVEVFSPEAVRRGSFAKYAEGAKGKKGTADVDDAFLEEIERWRDLLAKNIALRNRGIDIAGLNYAVQMTIDRIVFLRICEERGIEPENQLLDVTNKPDVYGGLCDLFRRADTKYNSGLFHFKSEKGQPSHPDDLTLNLSIDDKVLKDIISNLYYPKSPYAFLYIPSDILGQVYERFLGKVIRLTVGGQAKVEEKPEVRKAGGVYYTPTYIVEYIVKNTVGKLLEGDAGRVSPAGAVSRPGMTPKEAAKLKIVDPACGSGTFLLGAYDFLLNWHLDWYTANEPEKHAKDKVILRVGDGYRLTTATKKQILLNNIHGVDIDAQAVEVTKLSLLLKVLENASGQLSLGMERVLPDLGQNIKCGNSLIGYDYFAGQMFPDRAEQERVNPFDWKSEFPQVFAQGGFDAVIGNPPYVRQEELSDFKKYFQTHFASYVSSADLYIYFMEQGIKLLRPNGLYSIIVSSSFIKATYGKALRQFIKRDNAIVRIVDFGGLAIFEDAKDTYVCIPLVRKATHSIEVEICKVPNLNFPNLESFVLSNSYNIPSEQLGDDGWSLESQAKNSAFQKILHVGTKLGEYSSGHIYYGIKTGLNEAFEINLQQYQEIIQKLPRCQELIKQFLGGQDIRRYHTTDKKRFLIVIPSGWTKSQLAKASSNRNISESYAWEWFSKEYFPIAEHLKQYSDSAKKRQDKGDYWWELRSCDYYEVLNTPKIIYPDIAKFPRFFLDTTGIYIGNTAYCLGLNDHYLLGILNSKLFWFAISNISIPFGIRAGEYRYRLIYQYMEKVPIRTIDFTKPAEKAQHDRMVALVEQMLALHKASAHTPQEKERLARQIESTDRAIDALVYQLYGLTEEEIRIVEGRS